ncbi:Uncharacterised protein [Mycobacteroides abscessus subsp. abscessus]|nr:Uncharacterised protein [Mycobacteroides abscessus subsp. abscessus]
MESPADLDLVAGLLAAVGNRLGDHRTHRGAVMEGHAPPSASMGTHRLRLGDPRLGVSDVGHHRRGDEPGDGGMRMESEDELGIIVIEATEDETGADVLGRRRDVGGHGTRLRLGTDSTSM